MQLPIGPVILQKKGGFYIFQSKVFFGGHDGHFVGPWEGLFLGPWTGSQKGGGIHVYIVHYVFSMGFQLTIVNCISQFLILDLFPLLWAM